MSKTRIDDLAIVLSASTEQLASDLRAAARMMEGFKKSVDRASGAESEASVAKQAAKDAAARKRAAREAVSDQKRAAKETKEAWDRSLVGRASSMGKDFAKSLASGAASVPFAGLAFGIGAGAAIVGIEGLTSAFEGLRESVNLAADLEMTSLAFEVMLQSGEKATKMLADIRQFAATTPFNNAELTDSSRKLIAYGLSADQIIPTLRMLGDVASATQTPIGDLSYLYGTLAAQQRAYTKDIYQFANRGIPIYEELAKVLAKSVTETKDLIEEGKVGFPEVVRAFKNMTEGKGRYAGLTARQADTFSGVREQFTDALQLGKIKLGKILIDELGLKQGLKDLQKFVENIDEHMDRIRPAVRFVDDLARSVAQVGAEFGKAAINGGIFFDRLNTAAFPEMSRFLKDVREFLKSGKDIKIDPLVVNEAIFMLHDELASVFIDTLKGIKDIGEGLRRDFVKPVQEGMQGMLRVWLSAKDLIGQATPAEKFRPPAAFEQDEQIVKRFRALFQEQVATALELQAIGGPLGDKKALTKDEAERYRLLLDRQKELEALRKSFLGEITTPEHFVSAQHRLVVDGVVPPMKGRQDVALGDTGFLANAIKWLTDSQTRVRKERDEIQNRLMDDRAKQKVAEQAAKATQEASNALAGLAGGALFAARELANVKAPTPDVPWAIRSDVLDAAKAAKEKQVDPAAEFVKQWNDLGEGLLQGVLSPIHYDRAAADLLRKTGQQMGGPTQLPDAMTLGTAEATRALNRAMLANRSESTSDFLRRLVQLAERQDQRDQELLRKTAIPVQVAAPK